MNVASSIKAARTLKTRIMGRKLKIAGETRTICDVSFDKRGIIVYLSGNGRTTWIHASEIADKL